MRRRRHSPVSARKQPSFNDSRNMSLNESKPSLTHSEQSNSKPQTYLELMKQSKQQMKANLAKSQLQSLQTTNIALDHLLPSPAVSH
mmetsp:Transcript_29625/g.45165  ORF Transcript_29625/g.45165 Transcript_29625/m.45165 type:complete len:87 (+) Transcript_29625:879-1139(+)